MNFDQATVKAKELNEKPSEENLLKLYGLYKQATVGDVNTTRPGFWDLVGKAKWDSWESYKGMSQEEAQEAYSQLVINLSSQ